MLEPAANRPQPEMKITRTHSNRTCATEGPGPTKEAIARLARLLWEEAGRPEGYDLEFWLLAEAALRDHNKTTAIAEPPQG